MHLLPYDLLHLFPDMQQILSDRYCHEAQNKATTAQSQMLFSVAWGKMIPEKT
jgi:hypothetical protein